MGEVGSEGPVGVEASVSASRVVGGRVSRRGIGMNLSGKPRKVAGLGVVLPDDRGDDESCSWAAAAVAVIPRCSMAGWRQNNKVPVAGYKKRATMGESDIQNLKVGQMPDGDLPVLHLHCAFASESQRWAQQAAGGQVVTQSFNNAVQSIM